MRRFTFHFPAVSSFFTFGFAESASVRQRKASFSLPSLTRRLHFSLFTLSCSPPSGTWCVGAFSPSGYVRFARSPEVKYGSPPPGMTAVSSFFTFLFSLFTSARQYLRFSLFTFRFSLPRGSISVFHFSLFSFHFPPGLFVCVFDE